MKTEVRNEFILEAHKSACSEWKLKIEKECPELFETKLEVGKWYKNGNGKTLFFYNGTKKNRYGFNSENKWRDEKSGIGDAFDHSLVLATKEEVKEALINEAKKRGLLSKGAYVKSAVNKKTTIINNLNIVFESNKLYSNYGEEDSICLFKDGKFATIISTPIEEKIKEIEANIENVVKEAKKQIEELKKQL